MKFDNIKEQAAFLNGYDQKYLQISAGKFQGQSHNSLLDNDVGLYIETFNQTLDQRAASPQNRYAFMFFMEPSNFAHLGPQEFLGDDILFLPPGSLSDWQCPSNTRNCIVDISCEFFEKIIQGHFNTDQVMPKVYGEKSIIRDKDYSTLLRHTVKFIFKRSEPQSTKKMSIGEMVGFKKSICELLAGMLANQNLPTFNLIIDVPNKKLSLAKSIQNFIYDRKGVGVEPGHIARDFGISRRYLETIFKSIYGKSPSRYIQIVKLNEFRFALMAKKNIGKNIGDIAAEFEFWHLSRLAQNYQAHFGELPSETRNNLKIAV